MSKDTIFLIINFSSKNLDFGPTACNPEQSVIEWRHRAAQLHTPRAEDVRRQKKYTTNTLCSQGLPGEKRGEKTEFPLS